MNPPCSKPPEGWTCSRGDGHDGPCAARPVVTAETQKVVLELEVQVQAVRRAFGDVPLVAALRAGIRRLLQLDTNGREK